MNISPSVQPGWFEGEPYVARGEVMTGESACDVIANRVGADRLAHDARRLAARDSHEKNRPPRTRRTGASASGRRRLLHVARARSGSRPRILRTDPSRRSSRYHGLASVRNAADDRLRWARTRI